LTTSVDGTVVKEEPDASVEARDQGSNLRKGVQCVSKIVAPPWALTERDMSALVYSDYLPDVPADATWWRQRLYPGPDGNQYVMQIDNTDAPTQITISWYDDGLDETIEPYAMFITREGDKHDDYGVWQRDLIRRITLTPLHYLDVLYVGVPTGEHMHPDDGYFRIWSTPGNWEALTGYGSHIHPKDRDKIRGLRTEYLYATRGTLR
jgi:hypothetical protein